MRAMMTRTSFDGYPNVDVPRTGNGVEHFHNKFVVVFSEGANRDVSQGTERFNFLPEKKNVHASIIIDIFFSIQ